MLGYLILLLVFVLLFGASFYFAFREWLQPEDSAPIPVDVEYVRVETYFGDSFRAKMQVWLETSKPAQLGTQLPPPIQGVLEKSNGERILLLNPGRYGGGREHQTLICCDGNLELERGSIFSREIYSRGDVEVRERVQLQALAADGDVTLGPEVDVARWLDAAGTVRVGRGAVVHSRISSQASIQLEEGAAAQSLYAPLIHTGGYQPAGNYPAPAVRQERATDPGDEQDPFAGLSNPVARLSPDTVLVRGEVELKPGSRVASNLVVQGALRTGKGCILLGDVKADAVEIGPHNEACGNIVSAGALHLGEGSRVAKSVVAETDIVLATGTRVGAPSELAVVSAGGGIRMEQDVAVWGKVSAGKMATTV